jgi:hypothetical protein
MKGRYQPALLGGLFIGVLSSLPIVNIVNVCCCLWVVVGGLLTVYLLQQKQETPVETSEAMLSGLLAGLIGAILYCAVSWAMLSFTGALWQEQVRSQIESNPDVPPQVRDFINRFMTGNGVALLQLVVILPLYAVFSMIGALLGLAFFKKKTPPVVPS